MASLFTSITTKHSVHPRQPAPPPVVLPSLLTPIACFDFPLPFALTNIDPANGASEPLERAKSELSSHSSAGSNSSVGTNSSASSNSSVRTHSSAGACEIRAGSHRQSTDSDYESFKNRINEVAAQHLEMERYLDHQDEDAKKKVFDKLTIDYPFLKKCPECWPVAFCLQMKLHNNTNRANKRASAEAIATLKSIAPGGGPSRMSTVIPPLHADSGLRSSQIHYDDYNQWPKGQKRTRASSNAAPHVTFKENHEKFGGSRLAGRRAGRDRYLSLRINTICSQLFAPQKHEKLSGFGGSRLAGRSAGGEPFVFVFGLFATETLFLWRTTQKQMVLTLTEHTDALFVFEVFPVFSATEAREAPLVFGLLATETSFFPPQRHEKLVGSLVFGLFATETFGCFFPPQKHEKLGGSHLAGRSVTDAFCFCFWVVGHRKSVLTRDRLVLVLPEHADALFCLEDTMCSPLDVIRVNHAFCSAMGCSPMEAHRSIVLASPWVFHCLLKTTLLRGSKELFPTLRILPKHSPATEGHAMRLLFLYFVLRRAECHQSYRKPIRVLHYSTSRPTARWTTVSTIFQNSRADALRYPVVENVCYRDADRQPWIHDFDVTLEHGQKIASFRIFLKHGITLLPNKYSDAIVGDIVIMCLAARDGNKVVNVRSTDRPAANYIFNEALQRMKDFQSKKRIRLPPVLELTLEGNPPFPV
ncbi:hypothetical protein B0H14DRAFT_2593853 [Mycena olivaceomarginata]|nr:hypothetical protein B0H14DRAFT_2593853 [Mycena olivaceomarginata]